jgi:DNA-directed RNA polymerase subunit RPC12/RpoP
LQKNADRKRLYGITPERYEALKFAQRGVCAGCGKSLDDPDVQPTLDHKHDETKKVRGILCKHCNLVIGHAYENPEVLRTLADYVEAHA